MKLSQTCLPREPVSGSLPRPVRDALYDAARGRLPAMLYPVLARRLAVGLVFGEVQPRDIPPDLLDAADAIVAGIAASVWPGFKLFARDVAALERRAADEGRPTVEVLELAQLLARLQAADRLRAYPPARRWGLRAYVLAEDRLTARLARQALGSDAEPGPVELPLEDELFEDAQAVPLDEAVAEKLDAAARLEALAETAPPGERTFLAAWRREPDAPIAEIAHRLGIASSTARTIVQRLRARAATL